MIPTPRCAMLVACCAALLGAALGATQAVTPPPAAAAALPRSISDSNAAIDDAATLRKELDTLATLAPGVVRDARIAYRRIAFDLLFHGAAAAFGAQEMVIAGLRMTAARNDIDRVLERTLPTTAGAAAVNEALKRFTAGAAQGLDPLPPADHPERALAATLRPLEEAVALLERATPEPPETAWPEAAQLAAGSTAAAPAVADAIAQATWMDEQARAALRESCARARAAGGIDALRADTECIRALVAGGRIAAHPEGWTAAAVTSGFAALASAYTAGNAAVKSTAPFRFRIVASPRTPGCVNIVSSVTGSYIGLQKGVMYGYSVALFSKPVDNCCFKPIVLQKCVYRGNRVYVECVPRGRFHFWLFASSRFYLYLLH